MTSGRYLFARIALAFGLQRRQRRMAEAAAEAHLLREAEQFLGERIWNHVEDVEELGIEYWNLRRLKKKQTELREKLEEAEEKLREAHEERSEMLGAVSDKQEAMVEKRQTLVTELEALARKRDQIVAKAREVRRLYDGIKAKIEVLRQEESPDNESRAKSEARLIELRSQFDQIKVERDQVAADIQRHDGEVHEIDRLLETERQVQRQDTAGTFQIISEMNRSISNCKAELGVIETEMYQLFGEIGRHVSINRKHNEACRKACGKYRNLVDVMTALRRSILLNHRLSNAS